MVGACTDIIAGGGEMATADGSDSQIEGICSQQAHEAVATGIPLC